MALRAAPAPIPIRTSGRGRQPAVVEELRDLRDELAAHCEEALAFCDRAWDHVSALERVATEIGPAALKHAIALGMLLASYERRHLSDEPDPVEVAA